MAVPGFADIVKALSPLGYWRLGDPGSSVADSSGNGHALTLNGGVTPGVAGLLVGDPDAAMTFDGATGYVRDGSGYNAALAPSQVSIVAMISLPSNPAATPCILDFSNTGAAHRGYRVGVSSTGKLFFLIGNTVGQIQQTATNALSLNSPHLVICTNDGSTSTMDIDGASAATSIGAAYAPLLAGSSFTIGANDNGSPGQLIAATLDEIAIFGYALSAAQKLNLYGASKMPMLAAVPVGVSTRDGKLTARTRDGLLVLRAR